MPNVTLKSGASRALFFCFCIVVGLLGGLAFTLFDNPQGSASKFLQPGQQHDALDLARSEENKSFEGQSISIRENAADDKLSTIVRPGHTPVLSYHDGIKRVAPSVASVYAKKLDSFGNPDGASTRQGSGVIVDADGIVLTNLHILQGLDDITVVLSDGRVFAGLLIGSDQETDLAVVRIPATGLPFLKLNEAPPLKVGDVVLAIGNPFGVGQTVTQGIVSATRRRLANSTLWQNFIQIDAAINPGNSGGALINPFGQLVGVNTAVFRANESAVGIGFSIPADLLAQVVPQIIENGSVARGWLGLDAEDLSLYPRIDSRVSQGAVVTHLHNEGPAFQAGVKPGDVITQLGEQDISSATQLLLAISALPPAATVKLVLLRGPDTQTFRETGTPIEFVQHTYKLTLQRRPPSPAATQAQ